MMNKAPKSTNAAVSQQNLSISVDSEPSDDAPRPLRILLIHGSLRNESRSRFLTFNAERILEKLGAETRVFYPKELPLPDSCSPDHSVVKRLREFSEGADGHVWCSPERHGSMSGLFKSQIDWLALEDGDMRLTQEKTLAVMQTSNDSFSFNVVHQLRVLGQHMGMVPIPGQLSVPEASLKFNDIYSMPFPAYESLVNFMKEFYQYTQRSRESSNYLRAQSIRYKDETLA